MRDPLHELVLVARHPEHASHRDTYQGTVGATIFGALLVVVFAGLTVLQGQGWPLLGAALLGTVFTGAFAAVERDRVQAAAPIPWVLRPSQLVIGEEVISMESIVAIEREERPDRMRLRLKDRTIGFPPSYRCDPPEVTAFVEALQARLVANTAAEARPEARRALEQLAHERPE